MYLFESLNKGSSKYSKNNFSSKIFNSEFTFNNEIKVNLLLFGNLNFILFIISKICSKFFLSFSFVSNSLSIIIFIKRFNKKSQLIFSLKLFIKNSIKSFEIIS